MPHPPELTPALSGKPAWLVDLPSCPSSNSWALERLDDLSHGSCVWARRQSAGRGQRERRWHAPPGVLCTSFVLHLPIGIEAARLSLLAGLAVADTVNDYAPTEQVALKWPNDCYACGRKLAGVLCEGRIDGSTHRVVVGIGLNLDPDWSALSAETRATLDPAPISLRELLGERPLPESIALLDRLRDYLLEAAALLRVGDWPELLARLRQHDWLLGRQVLVDDGALSGQAAGIDDNGQLLIQLPGGGHRSVGNGTVRLAGAATVSRTSDEADQRW